MSPVPSRVGNVLIKFDKQEREGFDEVSRVLHCLLSACRSSTPHRTHPTLRRIVVIHLMAGRSQSYLVMRSPSPLPFVFPLLPHNSSDCNSPHLLCVHCCTAPALSTTHAGCERGSVVFGDLGGCHQNEQRRLIAIIESGSHAACCSSNHSERARWLLLWTERASQHTAIYTHRILWGEFGIQFVQGHEPAEASEYWDCFEFRSSCRVPVCTHLICCSCLSALALFVVRGLHLAIQPGLVGRRAHRLGDTPTSGCKDGYPGAHQGD